MRLAVVVVMLFVGMFQAHAQDLAIKIEGGDTVVLNEDGTWEPMKRTSQSNLEEIPVNTTRYNKPSSSTKFLVGGKGLYEVRYDPRTWVKVSPGKYNKDAELALEMTNKLAYAIVIYEKVEIPIEPLLDIAFENAKASASNMKILKKEYRTVNGTKLAMMQMEGDIDGIKATYFSYYYSNSTGTWQFHTFTMTSMFKQYKKAMEDILNGFVLK